MVESTSNDMLDDRKYYDIQGTTPDQPINIVSVREN